MSIEEGKILFTTSFMVNNVWQHQNEEIGEMIPVQGMSFLDAIVALGDPMIRLKREADHDDNVVRDEIFSFGIWKISLKSGTTTLSFSVGAKAMITKTRCDMPAGYDHNRWITAHDIGRACGTPWDLRPEKGFELYWEVLTPIIVRSRQKTGGYKIIGQAKSLDELNEFIATAAGVATWVPNLPDFIYFIDDGIYVGKIPKRNIPKEYQKDNQYYMRGVNSLRSFRNIAMLGFVHVLPDSLQIIPITGGSKEPYFLLWGEINNIGSFTSRGVIVNRDASGYLPVYTAAKKQFVAKKLDKKMMPLTFSDQQMIKLAISDYIERL